MMKREVDTWLGVGRTGPCNGDAGLGVKAELPFPGSTSTPLASCRDESLQSNLTHLSGKLF